MSLILLAYGIVFVTELVGDKTLYSICSLATRHRPLPIFLGALAAFMVKMGVAVSLGHLLAQLDPAVVAAVSAFTFFLMALVLYFRKEQKADESVETRWPKTALLAFAAIVFTEWGDAGQIATATLSARYGEPFLVWIGATLAIATKGALAVTFGVGLSKKIPHKVLRYAAVSTCVLMGLLAAFRIEL